jgi:NADH:ubiquinone oxidoreductase subunit 3 (subunit A)
VAMLFILLISKSFSFIPGLCLSRHAQRESNLIFGSMVSFLGILFVGYIYALKKERSVEELMSEYDVKRNS